LAGGYVEDPAEFDPYETLLKTDDYWFAWDAGASALSVRDAKTDADVLGGLGQVTTFDDLYSELARLTANAWLWINFYFYLEFPMCSPDQHAWTGADLWGQYLCRFRDLLR
jgi:hypothetical protein